MTHLSLITLGVAALTLSAASFTAHADDRHSIQSYCAAKTSKTYGFQCQGQAQLVPGVGLEPITLVGTVSGSRSGVFDGYATLNSGSFERPPCSTTARITSFSSRKSPVRP